MHGNGFGDIIGNILATILMSIYNCIYRPEGMTDIFIEYDNEIWTTFTGSYFWTLFSAVRIIGIGLLVVTCLITLMDDVSDGDFTLENLFRHMLKFFMLYFILMNLLPIFMHLLNLSDVVVRNLSDTINGTFVIKGRPVNQVWLANSINKHIGIVSKIGMFLLSMMPYFVSVIYTVILGFFAASRLIEIVVRLALAPIIVGISGISHGKQVDAIQFLKHTAGILFQIVVIMVISCSITLTHNAMVSEGRVLESPANLLILEDGVREIDVENDQNWQPAVKDYVELTASEELAYTKESTNEFVRTVLSPDEYIVGVGLMVAAIFMIFKSRNISTKLFY